MHEYLIGTVLSLISAHRRSQLKHHKLRVGNYICMDEVLEWFNYSRASAHPGCKVIVRMYQIDHHLVVLHQGQADSEESCIVLESRLTCSLAAFVACSM